MAKVETQELMNQFFSEQPESYQKKVRPQVDRTELYAYEIEIGKQLIDMDVDELFGMLQTFRDSRGGGSAGDKSIVKSYSQIASCYREIFEYYMDHYGITIRNPWFDKRMKGVAATNRLKIGTEPFTKQKLNEIIDKVQAKYSSVNPERADYIELILLLFYNGFANPKEVIQLRENDIDFRTKSIALPGRIAELSSRCFSLLTHIHGLDVIAGGVYPLKFESWHGSYFKFCIRLSNIDTFQSKTENDMATIINQKISRDVARTFNVEINYRKLYYLGVYDFIVKKVGEDTAKELINSYRDKALSKQLEIIVQEYGTQYDNISQLKKILMDYI